MPAKNIRQATNSLKYSAPQKEGVLLLQIGTRKLKIPGSVRLLTDGKHAFLSVPASIGLFSIEKKELQHVPDEQDVTAIIQALKPSNSKKVRNRESNSVELTPELEAALKGIPTGFRLGYGSDGTLKLVKTRTRRKKS